MPGLANGVEFKKLSVCRRAFWALFVAMSILFMGSDRSISSLLSDWTRGLVGALYAKLWDRDEDRDEVPDTKPSDLRGARGRLSKSNGVKCRGGEVASHTVLLGR